MNTAQKVVLGAWAAIYLLMFFSWITSAGSSVARNFSDLLINLLIIGIPAAIIFKVLGGRDSGE